MHQIIAIRTNRQTQTQIEIVDFGRDSIGGVRWATFCREHGTPEFWDSRKAAEEFAACPAAWCGCCERAVAGEVDERITQLANSERPWDDAKKFQLVRYDYRSEGEVIDPGVNFFVLALEHLGARPEYSCEGHPQGFYIAFHASHDLVRRIDGIDDFFRVEVSSRGGYRPNFWAIRAPYGYNTERGKRYHLRKIAKLWQKELLGGALARAA